MWPTISRNSGLRGGTFSVWKEGLCTHYLLVGTVQPFARASVYLVEQEFSCAPFPSEKWRNGRGRARILPVLRRHFSMYGRRAIYTVRLVETPQRSVFPPVYLAEQECLKVESPSEMEGRAGISACTAPALCDVWEEGYIHNTLWWGYVNIW